MENSKNTEIDYSDTMKIITDSGTLIVSVFETNGKPVGIYADLAIVGSHPSSPYLEAIGRLVTVALRYGVPVNEIVTTLKEKVQPSDSESPSKVHSIIEGIATILERRYLLEDKNYQRISI